ncbi:hypothetical protein [Desulfohalovibrio reitneri]|uniref:hypothetical protein n=1 Tax=Desulfohalovibrio reitneri TaxID=1307759 RepID=UPI000AC9A9DC|nr:hypothetical protein [Desulfohalovibrio reitneri]
MPYEWREQDDQDWESGVGDATLGAKLVAYSSLEYGSIVSRGWRWSSPRARRRTAWAAA